MTISRKIPKVIVSFLLASLLAVMGSVVSVGADIIEIPEGASITSATFSIYVANNSGETVNVHRVEQAWTETSVTWNTRPNFDSVVSGSFTANSGWQTVDVTDLVKGWMDGTYPNHGILLAQGDTTLTKYHSSEYSDDVTLRPKLEICYNGTCVTIQRPGIEQDGVADAYIWELYPDLNGNSDRLYTGLVCDDFTGICKEKQSLLRFDFFVRGGGEGCTPGYWKQEQHFDSWTGYSPGDDFEATFGLATDSTEIMCKPEKGKPVACDPPPTLLQALKANGGCQSALARHAVAALLNAASPDTNYFFTIDEIIAIVQDGFSPNGDYNCESAKDLLAEQNEMGCPINGDTNKPPRDCMKCQNQDGEGNGPPTVDSSPKKGHGPKPSVTNMHGFGPDCGPSNAGGMPAALEVEVSPGKGFGKAVSEIAKSGPGAVAQLMGKGKRAH